MSDYDQRRQFGDFDSQGHFRAYTTPEQIAVAETSAGLRLSTSAIALDDSAATGTVVTLSSARGEPLPELAAFGVGRLLTTMRQPEGGASMQGGGSGLFHVVLVDDAGPGGFGSLQERSVATGA